MKTIFARAIGLALFITPAWAMAQTANSVQFPAGYAPGQSICVKQSDGTCTPVSTTNPLPVSGGAGGGGGDASAANQTTQIAAEQAIQAAIGAATASPAANTIGDRLKTLNTTLGTPLQAGGSIANITGTVSLPTGAATETTLGAANTRLASIDTDIGTTADSVAASDTATASLIALMKRNNQNLTTLNSSATPAGTNIIGRVGIDQTTPGTTNAVVATGNVANAATDSGNPVKVGAVYRATLPTFTDGQRADAQVDTKGNLRVLTTQAQTTGTDGIANTALGLQAAAATPGTGLLPANAGYLFNGSTWDRAKKPATVARLVVAAASTNATLVKASPGDISLISVYNAINAVRYLKLYNKASAPTVGTDTPFMMIALAPNATREITFPNGGLYFSTGIAFAITGGAPDNDTTAIFGNEVFGLNIVYQ